MKTAKAVAHVKHRAAPGGLHTQNESGRHVGTRVLPPEAMGNTIARRHASHSLRSTSGIHRYAASAGLRLAARDGVTEIDPALLAVADDVLAGTVSRRAPRPDGGGSFAPRRRDRRNGGGEFSPRFAATSPTHDRTTGSAVQVGPGRAVAPEGVEIVGAGGARVEHGGHAPAAHNGSGSRPNRECG